METNRFIKEIDAATDPKKSPLLSENRKDLAAFLAENSVGENPKLKLGTRWLYAFSLRRLDAAVRKPWKKMSKADLVGYWGRPDRAKLKSNSEHKCVKKFLAWIYECPKGQYPACISWLQFNERAKKKLPEEILTPAEVGRMIECAASPRDMAIISVLYESGARIGELLSMQLKHVSFDTMGAKLMLNGKTGQRSVRVISSVPLLSRWLDEYHPRKDDSDAPLFPNRIESEPMERGSIGRILKRSARRAGIKKHVHPHGLRHARATELAKVLTEQELKVFFGWTGSSDMASIYVHLSSKDLDAKLLRASGKEVPEEQSKKEAGFTLPKSYHQLIAEKESTDQETLKTLAETFLILKEQYTAMAEQNNVMAARLARIESERPGTKTSGA